MAINLIEVSQIRFRSIEPIFDFRICPQHPTNDLVQKFLTAKVSQHYRSRHAYVLRGLLSIQKINSARLLEKLLCLTNNDIASNGYVSLIDTNE